MKEIYLIDAFNLIHAAARAPRYSAFGEVRRFVYAMERYMSSREARATVVFDGTRFDGEFPSSALIEIRCTNPGEKADTLLERLMRDTATGERLRTILVSEDSALLSMAIGWGVRVQKPRELFERMLDEEKKPAKPDRSRASEPFNNPFSGL